jgi:hypothetical protein
VNAALDILNTVMDAVIGALGVALAAAARAALANLSAAEWTLAAALAGAAWLLASGRGWRAVGVLVFLMAVAACAWLSWKAGRYGVLAQQAVLAAMVLHGLKGRGRAVVKGGAR